MDSRKVVENVTLVLNVVALGFLLASTLSKSKPTKDILLEAGITFLLGSIINLVLYKLKPGMFRSRSEGEQ
ncbi:MAG TPA: hypothetical protein VGM30_12855 [Puia sp.]|jgi:hypothetical protein